MVGWGFARDTERTNLSLRGDRIDRLKAVSYPHLLAAGNSALTTVARKLGRAGLSWRVIADDRYILRRFCDWAGSVRREFEVRDSPEAVTDDKP